MRMQMTRIKELKNKKDEVFVVQHPMFYRPAEIDLLQGDSTRASKELGWKPKVMFDELVKMMVDHDIKEFKKHNL